MASYQSRRRDPLLDSATQAAIEKRTKELLGLALAFAGFFIAVMVGSYAPTDPSWISATDAPVQNWLGHFGASLAAPLMMIIGLGIWVVPIVLMAWGARFVMHHGQERAVGRLIFAPVAIILASVHAATLAPTADWPANFGLGGLFGDTVLGVILTIVPFGPVFGVKLLSLLSGVGLLALMAFAVGFTRLELKVAGRFALLGTVMLYAFALRFVGKGAALSAQAAQGVNTTIQARRAPVFETRAPRVEAPEQDDSFSVPPINDSRMRGAAVVRANAATPTAEPPLTPRSLPPAPPLRSAPLAAPVRKMPTPETPQSGGFLAG
ncbi:MAG: S-DNA-T family DNA segregation ATPase FtsK/SpoIIIE, partial [Yoonia sp.]